MKLGPLKSAIRDLEGAPRIRINFRGVVLDVPSQKTGLLEQLDQAFTEGRAQETGLALTPEGYLTSEP